MDRLTALAEKIDSALRDDASGGAVFDMLPAWAAEYKAEHGTAPGTSGGTTLLDHYMREAVMEGDLDWRETGEGCGVVLLGRVTHHWNDAGFYSSALHTSCAEAEAHYNIASGEEG